jgi:hypothetical protein
MFGTLIGWMLAAAATTAPATDGIAQCKQGCASAESQTDRTTCELQCEQGAGSGAKVIRFQQTRELGGSPEGGKNAGGTTTTVTTQDPHGATTTTTRGHTHGDVAAPTTATAAATTTAGHTTAGRTTAATPTPATSPSGPAAAAGKAPPSTARAKSYAALASCQRTCNVQTAPSPRASCKLQCLRAPTPAAPARGDGRPFGASFGPPPPTPTQ